MEEIEVESGKQFGRAPSPNRLGWALDAIPTREHVRWSATCRPVGGLLPSFRGLHSDANVLPRFDVGTELSRRGTSAAGTRGRGSGYAEAVLV